MGQPQEIARSSTLAALVAADGTGACRHAQVLRAPGALTRDLADAMHMLCALHGRHPGTIDHALRHVASPPKWLVAAAEGFARERAYLSRLTAAAGPLPSTPGQAEAEAAVAAQRHAFDMLAQSDRDGCAHGAAAALVTDWHAIRLVMDAAAARFGIERTALALPTPETLETSPSTSAAAERARLFAAGQTLTQHRGLWQLLEARAGARGA